MKPYFDGSILILPPWRFADPYVRVPHRSRVLACFRLGDKTHAYVDSNRKGTLFWVHAVGPGFAGDCSRVSATCATRSKAVSEGWRAAVQAGQVRIGGENQ